MPERVRAQNAAPDSVFRKRSPILFYSTDARIRSRDAAGEFRFTFRNNIRRVAIAKGCDSILASALRPDG